MGADCTCALCCTNIMNVYVRVRDGALQRTEHDVMAMHAQEDHF